MSLSDRRYAFVDFLQTSAASSWHRDAAVVVLLMTLVQGMGEALLVPARGVLVYFGYN
jgi:hypothetical protein